MKEDYLLLHFAHKHLVDFIKYAGIKSLNSDELLKAEVVCETKSVLVHGADDLKPRVSLGSGPVDEASHCPWAITLWCNGHNEMSLFLFNPTNIKCLWPSIVTWYHFISRLDFCIKMVK